MAATQFKVKKDTFIQCCSAVETQFEQSVERDIILPDYCPDIFRILKCRIYPRITSQSLNGDKAALELEALIKVLYLSENSGRINVLEQKMTYNKTIDLPADCRSPLICAVPRVDYLNCRVINQRRVDIRGAVSVKVNVSCEKEFDFVSGAEGAGIQLNKTAVSCIAERHAASKRITVIEELQLGEAKPGIGAVLYTDCRAGTGEIKIVSGKAVAKGEIELSIAYVPQNADSAAVETMQFTVPFSQVVDIEGADSESEIDIDIVSAGCDVVVKGSDPRELECEIVMLMNITAVRYKNTEAVTDAFSTQFECSCAQSETKLSGEAEKINEKLSLSGMLSYEDGSIASVSCCRCEAGSFTVRDGVISGTALVTIIGTNGDGAAIYLENELPYEYALEGVQSDSIKIEPEDCAYQLTSDNAADVKCELNITGSKTGSGSCRPLSSIEVSDVRLEGKDDACALKLYRIGEGEKLWDIAKRYKTSVQAIIDENDLGSEAADKGGMLLIPLTN